MLEYTTASKRVTEQGKKSDSPTVPARSARLQVLKCAIPVAHKRQLRSSMTAFTPAPSKLPDVGTTIFTTMSQLAAEHGAVNLGQGFPDFDPDSGLLQCLTQHVDAGGCHQYAAMTGVPRLREAIASMVAHQHQMHYDSATEITVTSGATQALFATLQALVGRGDEVIVLEPAYDAYGPAVRLAGGLIKAVPLTPPELDGPPEKQVFRPDWDRIAAACGPNTRALLLNFPHNPTGAVLSAKDLDALESVLARWPQIIVISDEVYEHIVFDGIAHRSPAQRESLRERTVVISSFGKTFHTTGWKIGYVLAPPALTREIRKVHQFMVFSVFTPGQHAMAQWLQEPEHWQKVASFYQQKRDRLAQALSEQTQLRPLPCPATYFLLADYRALSSKPELEFAQWLTQSAGVAVIPVSAFHTDPTSPFNNRCIVRFCFAKRNETLDEAVKRLAKI